VDGAAFAALRAIGAEGWAFPPIVGSGQAGCILHYDANRGVLGDGELVVVDIGARHGYYCGDLTRTFPVNGKFSPRQRKLYDAVLAAYDAAVSTLAPGSTVAAARKAAFGSLEGSGLTGDEGRSLGQFFIHGLGHFLGLEAHDAGGESPTLAPGMIVTVEPGIYLPDEGIGIRVEDDYLITGTGAENLAAALPRAAAAVEAMLGR
jgi:Xaa-Pro aminopeptidase